MSSDNSGSCGHRKDETNTITPSEPNIGTVPTFSRDRVIVIRRSLLNDIKHNIDNNNNNLMTNISTI